MLSILAPIAAQLLPVHTEHLAKCVNRIYLNLCLMLCLAVLLIFFFACLFSVYGVFLLSLLFVVVDRLLLTY